MGVTLSAAQIREAQIYDQGFQAGKAAGWRAALRETTSTRHTEAGAIADNVVREVARRYSLTEAEMIGHVGRSALAHPRFLACWVAARLSGLSKIALGERLKRDATTVAYQLRIFETRAALDASLMVEARAVALAIGRELPDEARAAQ
jgi:chromosomal replication initiation ATPase DnaA